MRRSLVRVALSASILGLVLAGCAETPESTTGLGPDRTVGARDAGGGRGPVADAGAVDTGSTSSPDVPVEADAVSDAGGAPDAADDIGPTPDVEVPPDAVDLPDTEPVPSGTVRGTVWAPGNAPGMVPAGQEIPVFGALVYLSAERPAPIPQTAYCEACVTAPPRHVFTDHRGNFVLADRPAGDWWLVIQKGQFRIEERVTIDADGTLVIPPSITTFPSRHDPDNGRWIPRIALASGAHDHLEDILGKMGLGSVDGSGRFAFASAAGFFDVYSNGGASFTGAERGSLEDLVRDVDRMSQYHIIFIPCSGDSHTDALRDVGVLRNIREYVARGGNLYVTDWSGEWNDNVFPAAITLGGFGTDTPANAWDFLAETWNISRFGNADGSAYDSDDAEAVDPDLHAWLDGQQGPTAESPAQSVFNAGRFYVEGNWNTIDSTPSYRVGTDRDGNPVMDQARVYVRGSADSFFGSSGKKPLTVTYEPAGCGRVLYSTYHTTDSTHIGLAPQERVLVYLIMEIGTCRDPKQ